MLRPGHVNILAGDSTALSDFRCEFLKCADGYEIVFFGLKNKEWGLEFLPAMVSQIPAHFYGCLQPAIGWCTGLEKLFFFSQVVVPYKFRFRGASAGLEGVGSVVWLLS